MTCYRICSRKRNSTRGRACLNRTSTVKPLNELYLVIENGSANYVGEAVNGVPQGYGKGTYKSGGVYEGRWYKGKWHGRGKLVSGDGHVYEGEFANGEYSGIGKLIFKDGDYYEGQFRHFKLNGNSKMILLDPDFLYREGMWVDSKMSGKGKEEYRDGKNYEGDFLEDDRHGRRKLSYPDGGYKIGEWSHGKFVRGEIKSIFNGGGITKMKIIMDWASMYLPIAEAMKEIPKRRV